MLIAANKAVSIDYTLTNDAGEVIDSSAGALRWFTCMAQATSSRAWKKPWKARKSATSWKFPSSRKMPTASTRPNWSAP